MTTQPMNEDLTNLTNTELENLLKAKVARETELLIQILHLLAEVERRRLYGHSYPSLFEYCVKELKYSAGSAQRRIDTMRAMKLMPEIEQKLQTGELQMVVVSQAQSFFRQEKKIGKTYDLATKRQILSQLENKSARECEKELVAISPQSVSPDRRREIDVSRTELRITMNQELVKKLDHLKSLLSNKHPHLTDQELVSVLADMALKKLDPAQQKSIAPAKTVKKPTNSKSQNPLPTLAVRTNGIGRYIPVQIRREIWARDNGRCTFPGCTSKHKLQFDHVRPLAKGGATSASNLRLLCQVHNLLAARREFGAEVIDRYMRD